MNGLGLWVYLAVGCVVILISALRAMHYFIGGPVGVLVAVLGTALLLISFFGGGGPSCIPIVTAALESPFVAPGGGAHLRVTCLTTRTVHERRPRLRNEGKPDYVRRGDA